MEKIEIPEIDSALLVELLEDSKVLEAGEDQLGCMVRSLEAEIRPSGDSIMVDADDEDHVFNDILSDVDTQDCSTSSYVIDQAYNWIEMEVGLDSPATAGCDFEGWYVDAIMQEAGFVEYGDILNYDVYSGQSSERHIYCSLWE